MAQSLQQCSIGVQSTASIVKRFLSIAALCGPRSDPHGAAFLYLHIQPQMSLNSTFNFLLLDTDISLGNGGGAML